MTLLPLLLSAWWADMDQASRVSNQDFGIGLYSEQLMFPSPMDRFFPSTSNRAALDMYRFMSDLMRRGETGTSTITADKDTFRVMLDVRQFKPEEINVKLADKWVIVEAKHEEKRDEHGWISRQFVRKYLIPEQCDMDRVASKLSSDGVLTIDAPLKQIEETKNKQTIKIEMTGKPAIRAEPRGGGTTTTTTTEKTSSEETTEKPQQEKPEK